VSNIVGSDGQLTSATFLDYYEYNAVGTKDGLALPLINLNTSESALSFDVAHSQTDNYVDQLQVFVSVDCGFTFNKVYDKSGSELATTTSGSNAFYPTAANHWRREVISLDNYRSKQVLIRFVGTSGYGDNIFVDNISVAGAQRSAVTSAKPEVLEVNKEVSISPNPSNGLFNVTYVSTREGRANAQLLNSNGSVSLRKEGKAQNGTNRMSINANGLAKGIYILLLETPDGIIKEKVIIK
jgi:hypothetical protein